MRTPHSHSICARFFLLTRNHTHDTPLGRRAPLLWSDPVGARRRRARALRRRAPRDSGWLRVVRGGSGAKAPALAAHPNTRTHKTSCPSAGVTRHTKRPAEKHRCCEHHIATVTATHCNTLPKCCNMHKHDPTCPSAGVKQYRCTKSPSTNRASSSEKCCPKQLRGPLINGKYAHGSTPGPSPVCGDVVSAIPNLQRSTYFQVSTP